MFLSGYAFAQHGILIFHISNRYLDIQKVLGSIAVDASLVALLEIDTPEAEAGKLPSRWVVVACTKDDLGALTGGSSWVFVDG
jgi:hypothetical protein